MVPNVEKNILKSWNLAAGMVFKLLGRIVYKKNIYIQIRYLGILMGCLEMGYSIISHKLRIEKKKKRTEYHFS